VKSECIAAQSYIGDESKRRGVNFLKDKRISNCCSEFKNDNIERYISNIIA
jgi:hypothetical protein